MAFNNPGFSKQQEFALQWLESPEGRRYANHHIMEGLLQAMGEGKIPSSQLAIGKEAGSASVKKDSLRPDSAAILR